MIGNRVFSFLTVAAIVAAFSLSVSIAQDAPSAEDRYEGSDNEESRKNAKNFDALASAARLRDAVKRIDQNAEFGPNGAVFEVEGISITLVYDTEADRMRLVAPVADASDLEPQDMIRLMQANFDSTLDARYAVAQGVLWSVFLHPLSGLHGDEFGSGLGQTINLVATYGTSYSSGAFVFGGGDSAKQQRELIEELQEKSRDI